MSLDNENGEHWSGPNGCHPDCPVCAKEEREHYAITPSEDDDPDEMNGERVEWAENAIQGIMRDTRTDREDALCDLLCDLMHWCDAEGTSFIDHLRRGAGHYREETGHNGKQTIS